MINKYKRSVMFLGFILLIGGVIGVGNCFAQDEEKSIQAEELINKRPAFKKSTYIKVTPKKRLYRVAKSTPTKRKSSKPKPRANEEALLGLTVWKLRPAEKDDPAKELIEEDNKDGKTQSSEYTLERIESEMLLKDGERLRLSVESLSHSGYLYVIDRELYSDGTYSSPKLIYPTLRTHNRNNIVGAGDLIFIPQGSRNFRVKSNQSAKTQVAEVLTFIISPKALIDQSMLKETAIDLPLDQFNDWLDKWETDTTLLEEIDGAGQTITLVEQSAGQDSTKGLTEEADRLSQNDPAPQSVFRSRIKRGDPVLVNVSLKFSSN